jgi:hypothetical protein
MWVRFPPGQQFLIIFYEQIWTLRKFVVTLHSNENGLHAYTILVYPTPTRVRRGCHTWAINCNHSFLLSKYLPRWSPPNGVFRFREVTKVQATAPWKRGLVSSILTFSTISLIPIEADWTCLVSRHRKITVGSNPTSGSKTLPEEELNGLSVYDLRWGAASAKIRVCAGS